MYVRYVSRTVDFFYPPQFSRSFPLSRSRFSISGRLNFRPVTREETSNTIVWEYDKLDATFGALVQENEASRGEVHWPRLDGLHGVDENSPYDRSPSIYSDTNISWEYFRSERGSPRVTSETAIAHRYFDDIVNSSFFENACLQGTCFFTYKKVFFF